MNPVFEDRFSVGTGTTALELRLRRYGADRPGRAAVLLTHGGNTLSDIYLVPEGGLAGHLVRHGLDVWLLDWRASPWVVKPLLGGNFLGGSAETERRAYTVDVVAAEDLPAALRRVRQHIGPEATLSMVSYCLSGGAASLAIARGALEEFRLSNVVLLTLGLFFEVPWNGWLKSEDFLIERVTHAAPWCRAIDPNDAQRWPPDMALAYERWPRSWLPSGTSLDDEMLRRLTFMVGQPYAMDRLHPAVRGGARSYFGPLHIGLYLHASQMVRRGFAASFNAPDVVERDRLRSRSQLPPPPADDLRPDPFRSKRLTLVAAAQNQVWHRDSIDQMHDWLSSHDIQCSKVVLPGYNIHELLWGLRAAEDVYPRVAEGLGVGARTAQRAQEPQERPRGSVRPRAAAE